MKNPKNFDYDKQKPFSTKQYIIQKESESNKDDINKFLNEPPLIKGIEISQGPPTKTKKANKSVSKSSIVKKNIKINNSKLTFKKTVDKKEKEKEKSDEISNISEAKNTPNSNKDNISQKEELNIIIPTLPETEIIEPEEPLPEEDKVPNPNFCKNYISNLLNPIKEEIDPGILNGVEIGLNKILITLQDDMEENKLEINPEQKNVNEIKKVNLNNTSMIPKRTANIEA